MDQRATTSRVHNGANRRALREWREANAEEHAELWRVVYEMHRLGNPDAGSKRLHDLTSSSVMSIVIEEYPELWVEMRERHKAALQAEIGWSDGRYGKVQDRSAQPRVGGRWAKVN